MSSRLAAVSVLVLGCSPHESGPEPELAEKSASVDREQQTPASRGDPASGSAAYFHFSNGLYRLDARGWTQIWAGPVERLLLGADRAIYWVDRSGVHRLHADEVVSVSASKPIYDVIDRLAVGPEGELWESRWQQRRWTVTRIDPNGTSASWDDPSAIGLSDPLAMVVDAKGHAWFIPEDPSASIVYKRPDQEWAQIESWQPDDRQDRALASAAADGEGGVLILTTRALLRVRPEGVVERVALPGRGLRQTPDLVVNQAGLAVVRDAACNIDSYDLARLATPPQHIGQRGGHCDEEPIFFALDDRGRLWFRASEQSASTWDSAGREVVVPRVDTDTGELVNVIVQGVGPELPTEGADARP